eukprot:1158031-Pelagomonas_calceolata.AAC.3
MARENGQGRRLLRTTGRQDSRLLRPQRGRMAGVLLACQLGTLSLMHAAFLASARLLRGGEARRSMRGMPKRSSRGMAKEEHGYGGVQGGIAGRSPRHGVKG